MPVNESMSQVSEINLLVQSLAVDSGVARERDKFRVEAPWSTADFGRVQLRPGWWRLDCTGGPDHAEVRLSSDNNPLVVIPVIGGSARIYLGDPDGYYLSLIVSPWPGAYAFETLRLQRLTWYATLKMMLAAGGRLARRQAPLKLLLRAARRLLAGQALGLSVPIPSDRTHAHKQPNEETTVTPGGTRQVLMGNVTLKAREGDRVHQDAAGIVSAAFDRNSALKLLYSDVLEAGQLVPHPEWDADLAACGAFDNAPLFGRAGSRISSIGEAVEKWGESAVGRIPLPLVERGLAIRPDPLFASAPILTRHPGVSVIIPTKYRMDLLAKCLGGLIHKTAYPNIEVVVVDNGVTDARFPTVLAEARKTLGVRVVEQRGPFNFSRLVNLGAKASSGEIILLLNDDVEPIETGWMHRIIASALCSDVGAVGARLLYPDLSVQHAGVVLGLGGICAHLWRGLSAKEAAENPYINSLGARMAVTGACLAVKRSDFEAVGGFDEEAFPVAYNDIDFCLRLHAKGLRTVYRGDAPLIHHESQSRGADDRSVAKQRRMTVEAARFLERWRHILRGDRHFSPAFDPRLEIGIAHPANYAAHSVYQDI